MRSRHYFRQSAISATTCLLLGLFCSFGNAQLQLDFVFASCESRWTDDNGDIILEDVDDVGDILFLGSVASNVVAEPSAYSSANASWVISPDGCQGYALIEVRGDGFPPKGNLQSSGTTAFFMTAQPSGVVHQRIVNIFNSEVGSDSTTKTNVSQGQGTSVVALIACNNSTGQNYDCTQILTFGFGGLPGQFANPWKGGRQ